MSSTTKGGALSMPDLAFLRDRSTLVRISGFGLAFGIVGLAVSFVIPQWYTASITVVPASSQKPTGMAALLGGDMAGMAAGLGASLGAGADTTRIAAVLQSAAVTDAVIEKFDLKQRYGGEYQESIREAVWRHCDVRTLPKPNLVQLNCEDRDPAFAQRMLTFFAEYGNQVFARVSVGSAAEEARTLEKRVAALRLQAEEAAGRMRDFQEQNHIVDLDAQARALVSSIAVLNSQRISKQLELDLAQRYSSSDEPSVLSLQSQLSVMDGRLAAMGERATGEGGPQLSTRDPKDKKRMFPSALAVPHLRAQYEALYRDRRVAEASLIFSLDRLEAAKASEAREVSTFNVLDPATLPTRPSWPKRSAVVALFAVGGLALAAGMAWRKHRGRAPAATA